MLLQNYLRLFGGRINLLAIDPGFQYTGWAAFRCDSFNGSYLSHHGLVESPQTPDIYSSVRIISDRMAAVALEMQPRMVVIEHPPDTVYGQKLLSKDAIIGRMAKMFKVIAVCYALAEALHQHESMRMVKFIYPGQWQERSWKKRLKECGSKEMKKWSMSRANHVISYASILEHRTHLNTVKEQNTADAITIGARTIALMSEDKLDPHKCWAVPVGTDQDYRDIDYDE